MGEPLVEARDAYERADWSRALAAFDAAGAAAPLDVDDLERAALAAMWLGDSPACVAHLQRAFAECETTGDSRRAAGLALELCIHTALKGSRTVAIGWVQRAERLLEGSEPCSELGRLLEMKALVMEALQGDVDGALSLLDEVFTIGTACNDKDLIAGALVNKGNILVRQGDVARGMRLVDEAMLDAVSGQLGAVRTARVYCATISLCQALGDIRRACEWTDEAVACSGRPGMSDFPGDCRMHRAELTRIRGDWDGAETELRTVIDRLAAWSPDHVAQAWYELGEIALRRDDLAAATDAFARAAEGGKEPQPGKAVLTLLRGDAPAAAAQLRAAIANAGDGDPLRVAQLLPLLVRAQLADGDIDAAATAAADLAAIADVYGTVLLTAEVATSDALVAFARGDVEATMRSARAAVNVWRDAGAPYEAALAQHLVAQAAARGGDNHLAKVEVDSAIATFTNLGAARDLAAAEQFRERLEGTAVGRRVTRTFMFTDVVDSTRLLTAMGDEAWSGVLAWHDRSIRAQLAAYDGTEVKQRHGGDGFFAAFSTPASGMACAAAIQQAFAEHRANHGFAPEVRIGVHEAEALMSSGDYAGLGVHEAARIAGVAVAGDILASESTVAAAGADAKPARLVALKGLRDEIAVQSVTWRVDD